MGDVDDAAPGAGLGRRSKPDRARLRGHAVRSGRAGLDHERAKRAGSHRRPRPATAAKGETLFRIFSHDVVAFLERVIAWDGRSSGMPDMDSSPSPTTTIADRPATLQAWSICGLMLVATMLNYMDRQALAQQATEISRDLKLSNADYARIEAGFGLAFAVGGIVTGLMADRLGPRWLYPTVLLGWSTVGFATGWASSYRELPLAACCWVFSRRDSGPAH